MNGGRRIRSLGLSRDDGNTGLLSRIPALSKIIMRLYLSADSRISRAVRKLRTAFIRLPLNLRSNRWYVILGQGLYVRSPRLSALFAEKVQASKLHADSTDFRVYRRLGDKWNTRRTPNLDTLAILLPNLGRFGNAVREVVSALSIAKSLRIGNVFLAGDNIFRAQSELPCPGIHSTSAGPRLWIDSTPTPSQRFSGLVLWSRSNHLFEHEAKNDEWDALQKVLALDTHVAEPGTITVHLRGGDVFGDRDVRNYGQPPVAFYEEVLDHARPNAVHIVFQDHLNPVLDELVRLCKKRSIKCTSQSNSLKEDIESLAGAHTFVAGRGTFGPAIAGISPHLKKVYFFEDKFWVQPRRDGFELYRVFDSNGGYREKVLSGNWENRPDQLALMTSYPVSNLKLERVS